MQSDSQKTISNSGKTAVKFYSKRCADLPLANADDWEKKLSAEMEAALVTEVVIVISSKAADSDLSVYLKFR